MWFESKFWCLHFLKFLFHSLTFSKIFTSCPLFLTMFIFLCPFLLSFSLLSIPVFVPVCLLYSRWFLSTDSGLRYRLLFFMSVGLCMVYLFFVCYLSWVSLSFCSCLCVFLMSLLPIGFSLCGARWCLFFHSLSTYDLCLHVDPFMFILFAFGLGCLRALVDFYFWYVYLCRLGFISVYICLSNASSANLVSVYITIFVGLCFMFVSCKLLSSCMLLPASVIWMIPSVVEFVVSLCICMCCLFSVFVDSSVCVGSLCAVQWFCQGSKSRLRSPEDGKDCILLCLSSAGSLCVWLYVYSVLHACFCFSLVMMLCWFLSFRRCTRHVSFSSEFASSSSMCALVLHLHHITYAKSRSQNPDLFFLLGCDLMCVFWEPRRSSSFLIRAHVFHSLPGRFKLLNDFIISIWYFHSCSRMSVLAS